MNRRLIQPHWLALLLLFVVIGGELQARWIRGEKHTTPEKAELIAPYFVIPQAEKGVESFPLRSTEVEVEVVGVIADVRIRQVYENRGDRPLEAVYVFPGSTGAAVYGMEMKIGERVLQAKVAPRVAAREVYEKAKAEGKRAGLLEQKRANVFQMNVAQIMPGDVVAVDLRYTELITPEAGEYSLILPTVVGPRYVHDAGSAEEGDPDQWVANPYLKPAAKGGDTPTADPSSFDIKVALTTGLPLQDLTSPSHSVDIRYGAQDQASITLKPEAEVADNRDFVLRYRLAEKAIATGLLLSEGKDENFFTLLVEPPQRIVTAQIPRRDYIFVVDVSGSMHGFPLDTSRQMMEELLGSLRESDSFNIITFSGASEHLAEQSLPATAANVKKGIAFLKSFEGGGGTELLPALRSALALPRSENLSRSIVVITDGYVACEADAFRLIRSQRQQANLYAFGIGSSVNRHLIEGMARAGGGSPFVIMSPSEVAHEVAKFNRYIATPLLTGINFTARGFKIESVEPAPIPDLLAERPIVIMGKWKGEAKGELVLTGQTGEGAFEQRIVVAEGKRIQESDALAYLWARKRIEQLSDLHDFENDLTAVEKITALGLNYNLLTSQTSFVVVDETPVNPSGELDTAKQPLPLPKGVSEFAIGSGSSPIPSTPEPETWALLGVLAVIFGVQAWLRRNAKGKVSE